MNRRYRFFFSAVAAAALIACSALAASAKSLPNPKHASKPKPAPASSSAATPKPAEAVKPPPPAAAPEKPARTAESVQAEIDRLQSATGIDEATKSKAIDFYKQTLDQLTAAAEHAKAAAGFADVLKNGDAEKAKLRKALEETPEEVIPLPPPNATADELDQSLAKAEADLTAARAANAELDNELAKREECRKQLPDLLAAAKQALAKTEAPAEAPAAEEPAQVVAARATLAQARNEALKNEIDEYQNELASYDIRGELLRLRMDLAARAMPLKEKTVEAWREIVEARRAQSEKKALEQAQNAVFDAAKASPQVRGFAQQLAAENVDLVNERIGDNGVSGQITLTARQLQDVENQLTQVTTDFTQVTKKMGAAGASTTGLLRLLRQHMNALPDPRALSRDIRDRQATLEQVEERIGDLREQQFALADIIAVLKDMRPAYAAATTPEQQAQIEKVLKGLLQTKRHSLDALLKDYGNYFENLVDLDAKERSLSAETEKFSNFINQRVLWIRSAPVLGLNDVSAAWSGARRIFSFSQIAAIPGAAWTDGFANLFVNVLLILCYALLVWFCRFVSVRVSRLDESAKRAAAFSLKPTLYVAAETIAMTLPVPVLCWLIGWRLASGDRSPDLARAMGAGLKNVAYFFAAFALVRQALRPGGLGEQHFHWSPAPLKSLRKNLLRMLVVTVPVIFGLSIIPYYKDPSLYGSLGRPVFILYMLSWVFFGHALFGPKNGAIVLLRDLARKQESPVWRYAWYALALVSPAALAATSILGYHYTASVLSLHLFDSLALLVGVVFLRALVLRWLLLARRRVAVQQARKRREVAQAAHEKDEDAAETKTEIEEEFDVDLVRLDAQTDHLVKIAFGVLFFAVLGYIWSAELPALSMLDRVHLWQGAEVSLANVLEALIIGGLTWVAARDVPGLLELIILQRMRFMKGERYAISAIVRYAIVVLGVVLFFGVLGIGWANVQWLVAALGVGLGFGLQEIFANFISGLIILFERPIRVGDIVTVGGMSGVVTRIRIRATCITDFDRKEIIIPNKEFVTSRVTNWTLVDSVLRMVVPVSIAHGSDTARAEQLLNQIVSENPHVLKDPAPAVVFTGFSESALNFEARLYCLLENMQRLQNDLCITIDKALRDAGISLAVPRHEIRITTGGGE